MAGDRELNIESLYKPLIQQRQFHSSKAKYRLYGGAVGGGKTYAIIWEAILRCLKYDFPITGAIFRQSFPELDSTIIRTMREILPEWFYNYNQSQHIMTFVTGDIIEFCYAETDGDVTRYNSREWDFLAIDELTHFCVIPETQVLTRRGWVYITEVSGDDEVLSVNNDKVAQWKPVLSKQSFDFDGYMKYANERKGVSFCVTPNHKMVLNRKDGIEHKPLNELPEYSSIVRTAGWNGKTKRNKHFDHYHKGHNEVGKVDMHDWCEFLGWYLSEGYSFCIRPGGKSPVVGIRQMKRVASVDRLLDRLGWRWKYNGDGKYEIFSRQLYETVHPLGNTYTKFVPREILDLDRSYLKRFWDAFVQGDGHRDIRYKKTCVSIGLANETLIDNLQEVAIKLGYVATKGYQKLQNENGYFNVWRLSATKRAKSALRMKNIKDVQYTGKVWSITVKDNPNFLMRYNGRTMWTGNSEYRYTYLNSRVRTTKPIQTKFFAGTNPGNIGHCLTGGDVLTKDGWTPIQNVHIGDEVATDIDGITCYLPVSQVFDEFYSGTIYKSSCNSARFECTPDHKIPIVTETKNKAGRVFHKPKHRMVKDFAGVTRLPEVGSWIGNNPKIFRVPLVKTRKLRLNQPTEIDFGDYCELMGWFLSEGCVCKTQCRFEISQEKKDNREKIRELLDKIGFEYRESGSSFVVFSPHWHAYLSQFGKSREKFVPKEILFSDNTCLNRFFNAAMLGDGHGNHYYTISRQLADDMCEIGLKIGKRVYLSSRQRKNRDGLSYDVSLKENKIAWVEKKKISQENFLGRVYCLGIPGVHQFYVRQNGTVFLSGNSWVKSRWIDKDCSEPGYNPEEYDFIPSKVQDNIYLMEANPDYVSRLKMLPMTEQKALLYGDWDVFEGQFFNEWDLNRHTVKPFTPPSSWQYILGWDDGTREPRSVHLYAVDNDRRVWCVWEYYRKGESLSDAARNIRDELQKLNYWDLIFKLVVDPSMRRKNDQTGLSSIEVLESMGFGFKVGQIEEGNNDRQEGWRVMKSYLSHKPYEEPMLKFFQNCVNIIRTLPQMVYYQTSKGDAKKDDLDCFIAGTLVDTISGTKTIEDIRLGEFVRTPIGYRRVIKDGISGISNGTSLAKLSNGKTLQGTPDHKVFVVDKGLVELQHLSVGDILQSENIYLWKLKGSGITEYAIVDIQAVATILRVAQLLEMAARRFIGRYISIISETFQSAWRFITGMVTPTTTTFPILNLWTIASIANSTFENEPTCRENLKNGGTLQAGKEPSEKTQEKCLRIPPSSGERASIVESLLKRKHKHKGIARKTASTKTESLTKKIGRAPFVGNLLRRLIKTPKPVHIVAVGSCEDKKIVYNLTVEDAHLYYANGVLVTNSSQEDHSVDECRYVLMSLEGLPDRFSEVSSNKIYRRGYAPQHT